MESFDRRPLPLERTTFLFIGRLLTEKGIYEFCEAARLTSKTYPHARFIAVGPYDPGLPHSCSKDDLERYPALAGANGLQPRGNKSERYRTSAQRRFYLSSPKTSVSATARKRSRLRFLPPLREENTIAIC